MGRLCCRHPGAETCSRSPSRGGVPGAKIRPNLKGRPPSSPSTDLRHGDGKRLRRRRTRCQGDLETRHYESWSRRAGCGSQSSDPSASVGRLDVSHETRDHAMGPNLPAIPDTQRHSQPHRSDTRTSPSVLSRIGLGLPARLAQPEVFLRSRIGHCPELSVNRRTTPRVDRLQPRLRPVRREIDCTIASHRHRGEG